jgi:hypothetical protein
VTRRELVAYARRNGLRNIHPADLELGPCGVLYVLDDGVDPYRRADLQASARQRIAMPRHNPYGAATAAPANNWEGA